ncbi:MAG: ROK family protein, partial [Phycisphaeraceae bacterium]|nr:ROK family protein [Phycisphaeraceae bacterium]
MRILSVDIGGSHIKTLLSGETPDAKRRSPSGSDFTPAQMVETIHAMRTSDEFDVMTIGVPSPIKDGRILKSPVNLGPGWKDFDFADAFKGTPIRLMNDAAMQAVGSYEKGKMLFLGLGTGLGTCMIAHHVVMPMELGHLPFKNGRS